MHAAKRFSVLVVAVLVAVLGSPVLTGSAGAQADSPGSPVQWSTDEGGNGHWYQLSPRPVDGLDDAIQLAASTTWMGQPGYVVSVLSADEKDFLVSAFGDEEHYVIGYTDRVQEGVWRWVSGEPSDFTFWASGEPNNFNDEDFAVMNWQHDVQPEPQPPGAWNDVGDAIGYAIFEYEGLGVSIDIKPGSDRNSINTKSKGAIPVAILTADDFDATTVDPLSAAFGPAGASEAHGRGHVSDVDFDGDVDLVLHFRTQETGIEVGDSEACLSAETFDGQAVVGCEVITVKSGGEGLIGVLLPDRASPRWEADDRRFLEEAFDAAGVDHEIVNAEGDAGTQQAQAEQLIGLGAEVLVLVSLDPGSGAEIIATAHEAGVKVVDYDRLTVEGPGADVYVSFDSVQVGETMADVMTPLIDALTVQPARVALLNGDPDDTNALLFREGYGSEADKRFADGSWILVDEQWVPGWDNQQARIIFEEMLAAAGGDIDAVFAANDGLANAVVSAIRAANLDPVLVSGQDASIIAIQNILAGYQSMSVYKPIKGLAEATAEAAMLLLRDGDITLLSGGRTVSNGTNDVPFIAVTSIGVTKDNIAETVIADGFRTWDEICVGEFEQFCPADR